MPKSDISTVPAYRPISTSSTVGQATAIEQSRAVAEVQAAVLVAQHNPRSVPAAVERMREACAQPALAAKAFFRYRRGTSQVSGVSIHLARELARVWGNMQYGLHELRRDDDAAESEMQAFAWDLESNTRNASTFVNPHARDTSERGRVTLTDLRDIYENNANQGARRVREAILAVLPSWFVEEAKSLCLKTIEHGGGKPLAQRVADAVQWFEEAGVRSTQLEDKLGRPRARWEAVDVAQLDVIARSLRVGETTIGEEFPAARLGDEDFDDEPEKPKRRRKAKKKAEPGPAAEPETPATSELDQGFDEPGDVGESLPTAETGEQLSDEQRRTMFALFNDAGFVDGRSAKGRAARIEYIRRVTGAEIKSSTELTVQQAQAVIDALIVDLEAAAQAAEGGEG